MLRFDTLQSLGRFQVLTFRKGASVFLAKGSCQGIVGTFLNFRDDDPKWTDIFERNSQIRLHPVEWLEHVPLLYAVAYKLTRLRRIHGLRKTGWSIDGLLSRPRRPGEGGDCLYERKDSGESSLHALNVDCCMEGCPGPKGCAGSTLFGAWLPSSQTLIGK